jgi:transcriptional regulator with XRE-family HTH domain
MSIVENIRWLCQQQHTSIPKIEKELGFGNGAIYNWDKNSPTLGKFQQVAEHLNVSVDFLVSGFDREIIEFVQNVSTKDDQGNFFFPNLFQSILTAELDLHGESFPFAVNPESIITAIKYSSLSIEDKYKFLEILNIAKTKYENHLSNEPLSKKEEKDIAKDLERMLSNLESDEGLAFMGEPMNDETKELMKISLENSMRLAKQLVKKKFTPKKYK